MALKHDGGPQWPGRDMWQGMDPGPGQTGDHKGSQCGGAESSGNVDTAWMW